jgi:GT2 family glycosyltransferase
VDRRQRYAVGRLSTFVHRLRTGVLQHKRTAAFVERLVYGVPLLHDVGRALLVSRPQRRYQRWVTAYDTLDDADFAAMKEKVARMAEPPLLSVVVPMRGATDSREEAERVLRAQVYERWEVEFVAASDAHQWNAALRSATGDFVVVLKPSTLLRPHTLLLLVQAVTSEPKPVLVYADEDEVDTLGRRSHHHFKPDWNRTLYSAQDYFGGVVCIRRIEALAVGGCVEELDGDCLWGLLLRMAVHAPSDLIRHVPFVLSHRRREQPIVEPVNRERVALAVERRLASVGERAEAEPIGAKSYRVRHVLPRKPPPVSVIVPTLGRLEVLAPCIEGLLRRTAYPDFEVLLIVTAVETLTTDQNSFLNEVEADVRVRVLFEGGRPYNFAKVNNVAAEHARGELICFLNDDTEVIVDSWLNTMAGVAAQDGVAAVGAMLLYPNYRIQHAGVILGLGDVAGHAYRGRPAGTAGYHERMLVAQDVACVTAACMLVESSAFAAVGGFDETFATSFNDVDFCLRLRQRGWRIVWTPAARLYHKESLSLGAHHLGSHGHSWASDRDLMHARWGSQLTSDPYYNPNLSLDFWQAWEPAFPPRVAYPWRSSADGCTIDEVGAPTSQAP